MGDIIKNCPWCKKNYILEDNTYSYGCPLVECPSCNKKIWVKDRREIAISGVRLLDRIPLEPIDVCGIVLGGYILSSIFLYGFDWLALVIGGFFFAYSLYDQIKAFSKYEEKKAVIEEETKRSYNRLSHIDYALDLKKAGYKVPQKFLQENKTKGETTIRKGNEDTQEKRDESIEEYLLRLVNRYNSKEDDEYIVSMMSNCPLLTKEQGRLFLGIIIENHFNGKAKALDSFDKLIKYWLEEIANDSGTDKALRYGNISIVAGFLCGTLYPNNIVSLEESDSLSQKYRDLCRKYMENDRKITESTPKETHTTVTPLEETDLYKENSITVNISDDVVKQLRNLKSLYDDEILTEEEYQEKKAQILGR